MFERITVFFSDLFCSFSTFMMYVIIFVHTIIENINANMNSVMLSISEV